MAIKQPFNAISHMVGGAAYLIATPFLLLLVDDALGYVTVGLYSFGLVALFTFSVLFHSIPASPRGERWLERLDHVGIYLLIAGTYSPVALLLLADTMGWVLFILTWTFAVAGIVLSLTVPLGPKWLHITGYIILGWLAVIAAPELLAKLGWTGLGWLLGGGIVYSAGAFLYVRDRPHFVWRFGDHEVWHILVLIASGMHFALIVQYVL